MNAVARDLPAPMHAADLDDAGFLAALESCTLPPAVFSHRNHLRAAYLYLCRLPFGAAIDAMCGTLRRYTAHLGAADKYHETITVAFMTLVNVHRGLAEERWEDFIARNPALLDSRLLGRYYSRETLGTDRARRLFLLEPRAPAA
ncbi:MAG TPA: hypothetical protein VFR59_02775 [Steroidobacteraceae bacterium]|nr:hypothetical protein [Steroidobacteraceae bacterium]